MSRSVTNESDFLRDFWSNPQYTRDEEISRLRFTEGWTLAAIGRKYDISRERVRQIIGNTGQLAYEIRHDAIKNADPMLTNQELSEQYGIQPSRVGAIRDCWHNVEGDSALAVGNTWELWVATELQKQGHEVELQKHGSPFDILLNNNIKIDVKSTVSGNIPPSQKGKVVNLRYSFHIKKSRKKEPVHFYILVIAENEKIDAFVIPYDAFPMPKKWLIFSWPTARPEISKYQKYHERWDLLATAVNGDA